jgi:hypothetical protein
MADSNESDLSASAQARRRISARLLSIITVTSSCFLFAGAGCCLLTALLHKENVVDTPAGADEVAARIVEWTLPANFSGKSGRTIDQTVFLFEFGRFAHRQGRGQLIVAQLNWKYWAPPNQRRGIEDLVDENARDLKKINLEEEQSRTMTINNLSAKFQIGRGEDRASTTKYRQVIGRFRGKKADAIIILQFEDGLLTEREVDDFIKSIR